MGLILLLLSLFTMYSNYRHAYYLYRHLGILPNDYNSYKHVLTSHGEPDLRTSTTVLYYPYPVKLTSTRAIGVFVKEKFSQTRRKVIWTELRYLGLLSNTLRKNCGERLGR
jgi:hypothetical protein